MVAELVSGSTEVASSPPPQAAALRLTRDAPPPKRTRQNTVFQGEQDRNGAAGTAVSAGKHSESRVAPDVG